MIGKINYMKIRNMGISLIIASSFILAYGMNQHIKKTKNIITIPNYKTINNNYYGNYDTENEKILFQINILKSSVRQNNFMLHNYNKIFGHNINYILNQNKILYKEIGAANLSLNKEIKDLFDIKNIIQNHKYNYLEWFQNKNYCIPEISLKKYSDKFIPINNIKAYSKNIIKHTSSLNNIFYQSEEMVVGIKNTKILISSTKLLILSKVNFGNCRILYFSKYLNNLATYNKFTNTYNSYVKNQTSTRNKFILNLKSNEQKKSLYTKNYSSNKTSSDNYIVHRPYIITTPILAIVGVVIIFLGGNAKRKRNAQNRVSRWHINDSESFEMPPITKAIKEEITPDGVSKNIKTINNDIQDMDTKHENMGTEIEDMDTYQPLSNTDADVFAHKHVHESSINKDELPLPSSSIDNNSSGGGGSLLLHSSDSPKVVQNNNYQNVRDEVDDNTDIETPESTDTQNTISSNPFNTNNTSVIFYIGENEIVTYNNRSEVPASMQTYTVKWADGLVVLYKRKSYVIQNHQFETGIKTYKSIIVNDKALISPTSHTHLLKNKSLEKLPENEFSTLLINKDETLGLINNWLRMKGTWKDLFYSRLYRKRNTHGTCNEKTIINQVSNYLYEKLLSSKQLEVRPNSLHIFSNINERLEGYKNHGLTDTERNDILPYLRKITQFESRKKPNSKGVYTTYGWFQKPIMLDKREINSKNITREDYEYLQDQLDKLNKIESLLPESFDSESYYKTLLGELKIISEGSTLDPKISQLDKFIANEILHDLRELINTYKSYIDMSKVNGLNLPTKLRERFMFPNYVEKLSNSCLVRNNYGGISHIGISDEIIYKNLQNFCFF